MRPLRFILLLTFFVALPVFLTCWSLLSTHESPAETFRAGYNAETNRLRALFSFSTPSSLFPPSAVISLTNDNSTFFLARPAAFGPSLPTRGLSGQLWVGRGFGVESAFQDDGVHVTGWELGCSDVPGWRDDERKHVEKVAALEKAQKRSIDTSKDGDASDGDIENQAEQGHNDGTDDYLHSPLPDSNPARSGKPGEPANIDPDKSKKATHADIESLQESADIAGKVVLLARGGCGFLEKVKWVQRRGGRAVIVGEREKGGSLTIMYAKGDTSNVTIPAIFTSYNAAHLLSSLVPDKGVALEENTRSSTDGKKDKVVDKPVFTSTTASLRPTGLPSKSQPGSSHNEPGWMQDALAAIGLTDNTPWHAEDSRRPPGSGNIEWILQEDWDDDDHVKTKSNALLRTSSRLATTSTMSTKAQATSLRRTGDDFVIGVQDWRDTELIAPKSTMGSNIKAQNGKVNQVLQSSSPVGAKRPTETALKGGSITPGSGEYDHDQDGKPQDASDGSIRSKVPLSKEKDRHDEGRRGWFSLFSSKPCPDPKSHPDHPESKLPSPHSPEKRPHDGTDDQDGLWVTLTPTSVSTSPFFDTLLVLVVSPLVTLTVVYALLLLRSRIRRRRWRAPKSVVERLPVRTYHTTSTTSSTTSSQVSTPDHSAAASPLLQPTTQDVSRRPRPRSQTTTGVVASSQDLASSLPTSSPIEKPRSKASRRKKYTGRQLECVVCLEDYVDGESRVMSLPCGHEFHADCITPWLVNRRRTCPICKGDVVRSMARANRGQHTLDQRQDGEQTSDDVQARAAQTVNEEVSAAIPIPPRDDDSEDEDIERGQEIDEPLLGGQAAGQQSAWRNVIARSLSRLSGDTVWRQTPNDRSR